MQKKIFSIIIPTHNRPQLLRRAIDSVLNQTYKSWEIIIIDDGSDSGTYDQLKNEMKQHPIIWHYQDNQGPGAARKKGVELSSGAYIIFLDDDDYYLTEHFEKLVVHTVKAEFKIFRSGLIGQSKDGRRRKFIGLSNESSTLKQYWNTPSNLTALLFAREVIDKVPIETGLSVEDFAWLIRVFSHYDAYQTSDYTAVYVLHGENRNNHIKDKKTVIDRIMSMEQSYAYGNVSQLISTEEKKAWICHQYFHFTRNSIIKDNWQYGYWGFKRGISHITLGCVKEMLYTFYFAGKTCLQRILMREPHIK